MSKELCARCEGHGTEDEREKLPCRMCSGDGAAVPCRYGGVVTYADRYFAPKLCGEPSIAWDDESPRCEAHLPMKERVR